MRILLLFLPFLALAQTSNYPGSFDTDASLYVTGDNVQSTLKSAMTAGDNVAVVTDASAGWQLNMLLTVCDSQVSGGAMKGKCTAWEHMLVTGINGQNLTVTRGAAGTVARAHASGALVSCLIDAAHQQVLADAVKKIEARVGLNPVTSGNSPVVAVPTASGTPLTLGAWVDGSDASPQVANPNSSIVFQRRNGAPANIATAFTFDCASTSGAANDLGCITVNHVLHDVTYAKGGTATRNTVYADVAPAVAAISGASLSGGVVTVTTSSPHFGHAGGPVIVSGTVGMTGLNSGFPYSIVAAPDPTHFTISCGGCSGGPASGGTASMASGYFASWDSVWKLVAGIRANGRESDMVNLAGDFGPNAGQDATYNDAIYCMFFNCTTAILIDGDASTGAGYYHPLKFGSSAVVPTYPYIDTTANNNQYAADFALIGNNQTIAWWNTLGTRVPVLQFDSSNNTLISAPAGQRIYLGLNQAQTVAVDGSGLIVTKSGQPHAIWNDTASSNTGQHQGRVVFDSGTNTPDSKGAWMFQDIDDAGTFAASLFTISKAGWVQVAKAVTYASLPTCNAGQTGSEAVVNNSNTAVWGASIAGGGANVVKAFCNGSAWTVAAK